MLVLTAAAVFSTLLTPTVTNCSEFPLWQTDPLVNATGLPCACVTEPWEYLNGYNSLDGYISSSACRDAIFSPALAANPEWVSVAEAGEWWSISSLVASYYCGTETSPHLWPDQLPDGAVPLNEPACFEVAKDLMYERPISTCQSVAAGMKVSADVYGSEWFSENQAWRHYCSRTRPAWEWSAKDVATLNFFVAPSMRLTFPKYVHLNFYANRITGASWGPMAPVEYVELGITLYGIAVAHHKWITDWIDVSFRGPPCSQITPESNPCPEGAPARVATLISAERLLDVVAPTYFEVEFYISFSWQDSRISESCTATETDAEPDFQDPCTLFWRPAMNEAWTLPTALLGDEEPQVVEDFGTNRAPPEGTTFHVGQDSTAAGTSEQTEGLQRSYGQTAMRIRARFLTIMDYRRYPYDKQLLNITIRATSSATADAVRFYSTANDMTKGKLHPVWRVASATSSDRMVLSQPDLAVQYQAAASDESIAAKELADGFVDPALKWQVTQAKQLGGGPANLTRVYETTVTLEVQRECSYYVGNYLMLESILVLLAWITFLISPECTETRLSIALTLVLAINVFQIVLVENLPETGYLTDLSIFTICNTVLLCLIAAESILVAEAYRRVMKREEIARECKKHSNSEKAQAAARTIQRAARAMLRKTLGKLWRMSVAAPAQRRASTRASTGASSSVEKLKVVLHAPEEQVAEQSRKLRRSVKRQRRRGGYWCSCKPICGARKRLNIWFSYTFDRKARFLAYETDRISAFFVFPALFLGYTLAIFLAKGDNKRNFWCFSD